MYSLEFVSLLEQAPIDRIIKCLLEYLPVCNEQKLKHLYMKLIQRIEDFIGQNFEKDFDLQDCYIIFKIASIHCMFENVERKQFSYTASKLEEKFKVHNNDSDYDTSLNSIENFQKKSTIQYSFSLNEIQVCYFVFF